MVGSRGLRLLCVESAAEFGRRTIVARSCGVGALMGWDGCERFVRVLRVCPCVPVNALTRQTATTWCYGTRFTIVYCPPATGPPRTGIARVCPPAPPVSYRTERFVESLMSHDRPY